VLVDSSNNSIYHNDFVANTQQVSANGCTNSWDDDYPSGGNYWSDYTGVDEKSGPNQNQTGNDGIGDTPYVIDANNRDRYPLMNPWTPMETSVKVGVNEYPVIVVSNTTLTQMVASKNSLNFQASGIPGEKGYVLVVFPMVNITQIKVFIDDSNLTPPPYPLINTNGTHYFIYFEFTLSTHDVIILYAIPGDVNADGVVDIADVSLISAHWYPGPPVGPLGYDPNYDIDGDGAIDIIDVSIISAYWTGPPKGPLAP